MAYICFALWLAALGAGVHFGRRLAPWLEGANSPYVLALLLLAGAGALVWAGALIGPRPGAWARILPAVAGMALLGWVQPLMIERLHLFLYGVTGLLAWSLFPGKRGWARAWPAAAAVGLVDELAQALHPERVGDWRDVATNAAASWLALWALVVIESCRPARTSSTRR